MALKAQQSLNMQQTLTLTPQLQQAIKLLTLTHLEMTSAIQEEILENPMLEEFGDEDKPDEMSYDEKNIVEQNREADSSSFEEAPIIDSRNDSFDIKEYIEDYNNTSSTPAPSMSAPDPDDQYNYENLVTTTESLAEHLEWQLKMGDISDEDMEIAREIIYNINDDGYLEVPFEELIAESGLSRDEAFDVLAKIQELDPVGCGCQNLTECLLVQAKISGDLTPLLEKLIRNHLNDLQKKDYLKISKETGASQDAIKSTALLLQNFHPKPGRLVAPEETHYISPDIYVYEVGGEFVVKVNDEGVPRLRISRLYQQLINSMQSGNKENDKQAKDYVEERVRSAMWLIKSIQTRQRTIEKVAKAIVSKQQEFFKKGPEYLKPMVLRDVAAEIGMHESTVSRVTTNKYMHTPIGLFELKYFFSTAIGGKQGGSEVSAEVMKLKLKALIEGENPAKPLSDQKLSELLSQSEVPIARRTVAKYREMLGFLPASKRKIK